MRAKVWGWVGNASQWQMWALLPWPLPTCTLDATVPTADACMHGRLPIPLRAIKSRPEGGAARGCVAHWPTAVSSDAHEHPRPANPHIRSDRIAYADCSQAAQAIPPAGSRQKHPCFGRHPRPIWVLGTSNSPHYLHFDAQLTSHRPRIMDVLGSDQFGFLPCEIGAGSSGETKSLCACSLAPEARPAVSRARAGNI